MYQKLYNAEYIKPNKLCHVVGILPRANRFSWCQLTGQPISIGLDMVFQLFLREDGSSDYCC